MKYVVIYFICTAFLNVTGLCQYNNIVDTLVKSSISPKKESGFFKQKNRKENGSTHMFYSFSKSKFDLCYFPKQENLKCGFFKLFGKEILIEGRFNNDLACDLDYGSFELFSYDIGKNKYLILTAIRYGSGSTTRYVYCNLFDITDRKNIIYFPLISIYGSGSSFGDFNNDQDIDFAEIQSTKEATSSDKFILQFKTLDKTTQRFITVPEKYITFERLYNSDDSYNIIISEKRWFR